MPTYEMFWDCPSCGTKKLLGKTHRHCPGCGAVQDPNTRYFPPEDEKVAVEDHVFVGVDWVCERCDTPNSNAASHCVSCGDARGDREKEAKRREAVDAGAQPGEREKPKPKPKPVPPPSPPPPAARTASLLGCLGLPGLLGMGFLVVCAGLLCLFTRTRPTEVTVSGHDWRREVGIEQLATVQEGAWCDGVPSDARAVTRSQREKGTRQVPDGQTCKTVNEDQGDGTFKTRQDCTPRYRSEPVYAEWCAYTVDRWRQVRSEKADGQGLTPPPTWPTVRVDGCAASGCTRLGVRTERYTVRLTDADGKAQSCDLPEATWRSMAVGSRWTTSKGVVTGGVSCGDLKPL